MAKEIMETTIYNEIYTIMSSRDYGWGDNASSAIIRSTIEGMAAFLGQKKNKDFPVSVGIYDNNDKFHFGGIVEFQKAEEEGGDEGSWSIVFTFDENDIDKNTTKIYKIPEDQEANKTLAATAYEKEGMYYTFMENEDKNVQNDGSPQELMIVVFDVIRDYMRMNITQDPVLIITGVAKMTAVADTNTNNVIIGIEPDEKIRQYVKDDASI